MCIRDSYLYFEKGGKIEKLRVQMTQNGAEPIFLTYQNPLQMSDLRTALVLIDSS